MFTQLVVLEFTLFSFLFIIRLAAVAERGEKPSMHIFDLRTLRRKKTLTTSDLLTKVSATVFSSNIFNNFYYLTGNCLDAV